MDMLDPQKMAANPQAMSQIYGSTDPNAYAPGQLDNELARIRTLRGQGALPPGRQPQGMPGQGMNLQSLLQQRDQLYRDFASAPQIRNPQQEMRYQNLQVGLGNLTKMIEQEQNREIAAEERKMKMDLLKQAQEDAQKMKREAHFEKLRKMGNAQRIAQLSSGNNNAGTYTGAGGSESVPVVYGGKTAPPTSSITKYINSKKYDKAMDSIEQRKMMLLNLAATLPTTETSSNVIEYELGQLGKLQELAVGNQAKEEAAKQLLSLQKLKNLGDVEAAKAKQKPLKPEVDPVKKNQIDVYSKITDMQIDEDARKRADKDLVGMRDTAKVPFDRLTYKEALEQFKPQLDEAAQAMEYQYDPNFKWYMKDGKPMQAPDVKEYFIWKYSEDMKQARDAKLAELTGQVATPGLGQIAQAAPQQTGMAMGGGAVYGELERKDMVEFKSDLDSFKQSNGRDLTVEDMVQYRSYFIKKMGQEKYNKLLKALGG